MVKPKVVILIQARTANTRFPGKVLKKILGKEVLLYVVKRAHMARFVDRVVVITSNRNEDNAIVSLCRREHIDCFRGSENDLLDRHYRAAKKYGADFVVKIPSDQPLIDPQIIERVIGLWLKNRGKYDYVSNYHPPTFPDGLDVEGCRFQS